MFFLLKVQLLTLLLCSTIWCPPFFEIVDPSWRIRLRVRDDVCVCSRSSRASRRNEIYPFSCVAFLAPHEFVHFYSVRIIIIIIWSRWFLEEDEEVGDSDGSESLLSVFAWISVVSGDADTLTDRNMTRGHGKERRWTGRRKRLCFSDSSSIFWFVSWLGVESKTLLTWEIRFFDGKDSGGFGRILNPGNFGVPKFQGHGTFILRF